jgi:hypothetical protein
MENTREENRVVRKGLSNKDIREDSWRKEESWLGEYMEGTARLKALRQ